jgi:eukaryotic-like serine/threonine-protein kinase
MPSKVSLRVTNGDLQGQEYVFDERSTSIVGRSLECSVKIPNDAAHKMISRHHCLLDINPPDIRVRDFGSLHGTYVGDKRIGKRENEEQRGKTIFPEFDLKDGDEFSLGKPGREQSVVFRVGIFVPTCCAGCSEEIPEDQKVRAERSPGVFQCEACRTKEEEEAALRKQPLKIPAMSCSRCGRDVSSEVGENRQGEFVCAQCKANPQRIIMRLLEHAKSVRWESGDEAPSTHAAACATRSAKSVRWESGDEALLAIRGYRILKELGAGGMGAVYLAEHGETGKQVALKVMLPHVAMQKKSKETFLREAENTRAMDHRNIVRMWDFGCSEGTFFFTLEFCDGGSLKQRIEKRGGTLPVEEATTITLQALDGLEYAHHAAIPNVKMADGTYGRGYGLVHRDLKPHNLLVSGSGSACVVKIADFGLAKAFDLAGLSGQTATGAAAGTPYFMPRQQVINQ